MTSVRKCSVTERLPTVCRALGSALTKKKLLEANGQRKTTARAEGRWVVKGSMEGDAEQMSKEKSTEQMGLCHQEAWGSLWRLHSMDGGGQGHGDRLL